MSVCLAAMQERLDRRPDAMGIRRATVEHLCLLKTL
jgi:hypothetical protein